MVCSSSWPVCGEATLTWKARMTLCVQAPRHLERPVHHKGIHESRRGVPKSVGNTADDFKTHALPEPDGAFIAADHDVELHGQKAALAGAIKGVAAHGLGDSAACGPGGSHVSAVGDVRSVASLVGAKVVRSDDFTVDHRDKNLVSGREPVAKGVGFGEIAGQRVCFARADGRLDDAPDGG